MRVIIAGGSATGTSTAHRPAACGAEVAPVERTGVACAASGRSGGILKLDGCDGHPMEGWIRRSFALLARLEAPLDGDRGPGTWGIPHAPAVGEAVAKLVPDGAAGAA